jgi:hypothetical protein
MRASMGRDRGARSVSWTQECDAGKPRSLPAQPRAGRHESRFVPHRADLDRHHRGDGRQHGHGRRPRGGEREEKVPTRGDAPDPGILTPRRVEMLRLATRASYDTRASPDTRASYDAYGRPPMSDIGPWGNITIPPVWCGSSIGLLARRPTRSDQPTLAALPERASLAGEAARDTAPIARSGPCRSRVSRP